MTVKELIEQLQRFDGDMAVIYADLGPAYEPHPHSRKLEFDTDYYTGTKYVRIPKNTEYVML